MSESIVVLTVPTHRGTYEAFSKLRNAPGFHLGAAAVVERDENGQVRVADGVDRETGAATTGGSLVGMLVGVLGGPLGMLLGLGAGALAGSFVDASRLEFGDDIVSDFAKTVPPGGNAILAQVTEDGTAALDAFAASVDGVLVRRPVAEVISEIEAQQQAAEAAAEAARKALRDQKRRERQEKAQERLDKIQESFNALKAKFRDEKK